MWKFLLLAKHKQLDRANERLAACAYQPLAACLMFWSDAFFPGIRTTLLLSYWNSVVDWNFLSFV